MSIRGADSGDSGNIQKAIDQAVQKYEKGCELIDEMQKDADQILRDEKQMPWAEWERELERCGWGFYEWILPDDDSYFHDHLSHLRGDVAKLEEKIKACQEQLDKMGFSAIDDAVNSLLHNIEKIGDHSLSIRWGDFKKDLRKAQVYINQIFDAIREKLKARELMDELDAHMDNGDFDPSVLMKYAVKVAQAQYQEASILGSMMGVMADDIVNYHAQEDKAKADLHHAKKWTSADFWNGKAAKYRAIIRNTQYMQTLLTDVIGAVGPELASLMPDLTQITVMLDSLVKQVFAILKDTHLSAAAKAEKIMNLFVFVMSILGLIQQFAAKQKANNDKTMAKASIDASKMSIEDTKMEQKELLDDLKYAHLMGKIMKAAQITMDVLMTWFTPGIATKFVLLIFTFLDAFGVMDKLRDAIDDKIHSKVGSEAIVAGIEITAVAASAFVDAALEAAAESAAEAVEVMIEEAIEQIVSNAVKEAAEAAGKAGDEAVEQAARDTIEQTVRQAVRSAVEKSIANTMKHDGLNFSLQFARAAGKAALQEGDGIVPREAIAEIAKQATARVVEQSAKEAATEAAETAAKDSAKMMEMFGKVDNFTAEQSAQFAEIAENAAKKAVEKGSRTASEDAAETAEKSWLKKVFGHLREVFANPSTEAKAVALVTYAAASNNPIVDGLGPMLKKMFHMSDEEYQKLVMALKVIQELMRVVAMMVGSGMLSQATMAESSKALMKVANAMMIAPIGAQVYANAGMAQADKGQAHATEAIAKTQGALDLITHLESEILKDGKQERARDAKELEQMQEENLRLASSLFAYQQASAEVLAPV